jgi:hypothetical protein
MTTESLVTVTTIAVAIAAIEVGMAMMVFSMFRPSLRFETRCNCSFRKRAW